MPQNIHVALYTGFEITQKSFHTMDKAHFL